jgi:hypothetical protein
VNVSDCIECAGNKLVTELTLSLVAPFTDFSKPVIAFGEAGQPAGRLEWIESVKENKIAWAL